MAENSTSNNRDPKEKIFDAIKQGDLEGVKQGWREWNPPIGTQTVQHKIDDMLEAAIKSDDKDIVDYIIKKGGISVSELNNSLDNQGNTWLMVAVKQGKVEAVKSLIANGAIPDLQNTNEGRSTALMYAAQTSGKDKTKALQMMQILVEAGANPNAADTEGNTVLHYAAEFGTKPMIDFLANLPTTNTNALNHDSTTPLMFAGMSRNAETGDVLLAYDANGTLRDRFGWSAQDYWDNFQRASQKRANNQSVDIYDGIKTIDDNTIDAGSVAKLKARRSSQQGTGNGSGENGIADGIDADEIGNINQTIFNMDDAAYQRTRDDLSNGFQQMLQDPNYRQMLQSQGVDPDSPAVKEELDKILQRVDQMHEGTDQTPAQSAALPAKNITIPASPAIRDALAKYLDPNHHPQRQPHEIPLLAAVPQLLKNTPVLS